MYRRNVRTIETEMTQVFVQQQRNSLPPPILRRGMARKDCTVFLPTLHLSLCVMTRGLNHGAQLGHVPQDILLGPRRILQELESAQISPTFDGELTFMECNPFARTFSAITAYVKNRNATVENT